MVYQFLLLFFFFRQMKFPAITTTLEEKNKTLYLQVRQYKYAKIMPYLLYFHTA